MEYEILHKRHERISRFYVNTFPSTIACEGKHAMSGY